MKKEWFENWFDSPYYHLLYKNRSQEEATDFVNKLIDKLELKKGDTLLDLACGKGRHAFTFSKHGLDVTGVDLSNESIIYAKQFEQENLHFYVHDMRKIFRVRYFQFVCNLFTSFGYFKRPHDHILAARSIEQGLKKDGKFLIDFVNQNHAVNNILSNPSERKEINHVVFQIERTFRNNQFIKKIFVQDGEKNIEFEECVNSFTISDLKKLFEQVGLTFLKAFGDYQLNEYDEQKSPRMILLFKK